MLFTRNAVLIMQVPATVHREARFGPFTVDLICGELRQNSRKIPLQEKPFQILALLLDQPGELVTREELRGKLWPADTFVDFEHSINTAVKKLREAIGDDPENPRFIETLPKRGYRFIARLEETPIGEGRPVLLPREKPAEPGKTSPSRMYGHWQLLLSAGALLVSIALLVGHVGAVRDWLWRRSVTRGAPVPIQSLAVLPFENLSGDSSKDYFADGFTDELITDLAEQTKARVVSRSSVMRYKGSRKPLPEIARELNVDAIVEGSVSLSERQVRITAQLIQASADRHLWAHSYERDRKDLFSIQSEVATTIADLLHTKADGMASGSVRATASPQRFTETTYELFLDCRNLKAKATDESVNHAIECYQRILALDPNSAAAYAELANCYLLLSDPRAKAAAIKALDLDSSLPEAHLALADLKALQEYDVAGGENEFQRALALNPSYAQAHVDHVFTLVAMGRMEEAISEARTARELDPFSAAHAVFYGRILFMAGQYDKAIEQEKSALELEPQRGRADYWLGYAYEQKGMYRNAIVEYERMLPNDDHGIFLAALGRSFALAGDSTRASEVNRKIEHFSGKDFMWPYDAALFYSALGDKDEAFKWLEKDRKMRDGWLLFLRVDPRLSALQSDPRFAELARRVGLPAQN